MVNIETEQTIDEIILPKEITFIEGNQHSLPSKFRVELPKRQPRIISENLADGNLLKGMENMAILSDVRKVLDKLFSLCLTSEGVKDAKLATHEELSNVIDHTSAAFVNVEVTNDGIVYIDYPHNVENIKQIPDQNEANVRGRGHLIVQGLARQAEVLPTGVIRLDFSDRLVAHS